MKPYVLSMISYMIASPNQPFSNAQGQFKCYRNGCSPSLPGTASRAEPARISGLEIPAPNNTMILM